LFFENLFLFLQRLDPADRTTALEFVRRNLIFISRDEFQQLAHVLHYDHIRQRHLDVTATATGIPRHRLALLREAPELARVQRASLYVALSDGARIDYFRRHNLDINNEQVLTSYDPGESKLAELSSKLAEVHGSGAKFECVFLVDDFCGSGRTLAREIVTSTVDSDIAPLASLPSALRGRFSYDYAKRTLAWQYRGELTEEEKTELTALSANDGFRAAVDELARKAASRETEVKGALSKIAQTGLIELMNDGARVFLSPLLATEYAVQRLTPIIKKLPAPLNRLEILPAAVISNSTRIVAGGGDLADLCVRYYSSTLGDEHTGDVTFGYDDCGFPVVLHHNTPNNSVYWLWARKWGDPLFVRYERHGREVNS
jgi:hypothetical protein